jgi:hypothetical protein
MAAKNNNQLLLLAALGVGGFFVWQKVKDGSVAGIIQPASALPSADPTILPNQGQVLATPTAPQQTYTGVVPTAYGPVIPSNFNTAGTAPNASVQARMQDILFRHQYIFNSVAYGLQYKSQVGAADPGIDQRIATLRAKDEVLQTEWGTYTGGQRIPDGTINTPEKKAAYVAWLKARGWCDPLVGVPC